MKAENLYRQIAEEISAGQQDSAVWTWALAESGGNLDQTKALYIRRRYAALSTKLTEPSPAVGQESGLQGLRGELRRQLAAQRKQSLYSVIGVAADSSDATIAETIARLNTAGTPPNAEVSYAMEALGNPIARERFDRHLLEQLNASRVGATAALQADQNESGTLLGGALKLLAGVTLVLGIGYLGLGFTREKSSHEIRLKEVAIQKDLVDKSAEIADRVVDNQKTAIEVSSMAQERNAEARERAQLDAQMRDDRRRLDQAYQAEQQLARNEQRRQQMEQRQLDAEAQRKAYEATVQTRNIQRQAIQDAMARGNINEAQRLRNQLY